MRDGLEGRFDLAAPPNWAAGLRPAEASGCADRARSRADVAQQFGDTELARQHLADAAQHDRARRRSAGSALQTLTAQRRPQLSAELPALLDDRALRVDAIRAIAAFDDESLGKLLIERYTTFTAAEKAEAIQTLAVAPALRADADRGARQGASSRAATFPPTSPGSCCGSSAPGSSRCGDRSSGSATEEKAYAQVPRPAQRHRADAAPTPRNGRGVFQRTCGACHKLYGEGGTIGPDLTGSNRANLDCLLFNVLEPNAEVQDAYKMVVVTTRDGRTYSGNVVAENDRQLTLRVVGREAPWSITKSDIQSREATAVSMMPPGLFDALTDARSSIWSPTCGRSNVSADLLFVAPQACLFSTKATTAALVTTKTTRGRYWRARATRSRIALATASGASVCVFWPASTMRCVPAVESSASARWASMRARWSSSAEPIEVGAVATLGSRQDDQGQAAQRAFLRRCDPLCEVLSPDHSRWLSLADSRSAAAVACFLPAPSIGAGIARPFASSPIRPAWVPITMY